LANTTALLGAKENLSPIEQQFLDLARISVAKDSIIAHQKTEIEKIAAQVQTAAR
jgi:hypothetical protein